MTLIGNLPPPQNLPPPYYVRYKRAGRGQGPNWLYALIHGRSKNPIETLRIFAGPLLSPQILPVMQQLQKNKAQVASGDQNPELEMLVENLPSEANSHPYRGCTTTGRFFHGVPRFGGIAA